MKVFMPYLVWNTVFDNTRAVTELGRRPAPFSQYCYPLLKFSRETRFTYPYQDWPGTPGESVAAGASVAQALPGDVGADTDRRNQTDACDHDTPALYAKLHVTTVMLATVGAAIRGGRSVSAAGRARRTPPCRGCVQPSRQRPQHACLAAKRRQQGPPVSYRARTARRDSGAQGRRPERRVGLVGQSATASERVRP